VWLAKERVLDEFTAFVASLSWVLWSSEDKEAFARAVVPVKAEFMVTRDAPFLFRDSLLEKLRNFYDLHACKSGVSPLAARQQASAASSVEGLEGWSLPVLSFGKHKGLTFSEARREALHPRIEQSRLGVRPKAGNYLEWVLAKTKETPDFAPMARFATYIAFKKQEERKLQEAEERAARLAVEKGGKRRRKKKAENKAQAPADVIACRCGVNFDDKESLFIRATCATRGATQDVSFPTLPICQSTLCALAVSRRSSRCSDKSS
jgi:hypothetical protein